MGRAVAALVVVLLLSAAGCGGGAVSPRPAEPQALPAVASLDSLRGAAAEHGGQIDLARSVFSNGVTSADGGLDFAAAPGLSCALYRISASYIDILSLSVSGSGDLWVVVPDFDTGRWELQQPLPPEGLTVDLSTFADPLSPAGYAYVAIVGGEGGGHLSGIAYLYDGPTHLYFVAPDGDDSNPGDADAPWATLQHAADMVQEDTVVVVRQGVYEGFTVDRGGIGGGEAAFHGEQAQIAYSAPGPQHGIEVGGSARYLTFEGLRISGFPGTGISIQGSKGAQLHHLTVKACTVDTCQTGIEIQFADNVTLEALELHSCSNLGARAGYDSDGLTLRRCVFHDNAAGGIEVSDGGVAGGVLDDAHFEGNLCYSHSAEGSWGMQVEGVSTALFVNNLVYGCRNCVRLHGDGGTPVADSALNHNTFVSAAGYNYCVAIAGGCSGVGLHNNVLINPNDFFGSLNIDNASLASLSCDNNVYSTFLFLNGSPQTIPDWQTATGQDAASVYGEVVGLFENYAGGNFRLKAGSAALNLALPQYAPEKDFDGAPRPGGAGHDCGCYESAL
jgi:hypothetical protein